MSEGISQRALAYQVKRWGLRSRRALLAARPAWLIRNQQERFVIAHMGRCGSTVLGDLLNQHSLVTYRGEIYGQHLFRVKRDHGKDAWRDVDLPAVLDRELRASGGAPWIGFDYVRHSLAVTQTDFATHALGLSDRGFRPILLSRRNHLARLVSSRSAISTRVWHSRASQEQPSLQQEPDRVIVPVRARQNGQPPFLARIEETDKFYSTLRDVYSDQELLELVYEDDIAPDPRIGYRRVIQYLGLEPQEPQVRLHRLGVRPLRDRIANLDEVEAFLRGTAHEWMLDA